MIGVCHQEIVDWLVGPWRTGAQRICVVEGFSGVGKTEVASEFEKRVPVAARVDAPESGELDDLLLDLGEQLATQSHPEVSKAVDAGRRLDVALEAVLAKPVTIVIDEFQRMLDPSEQAPVPRVAALVEQLSKRSAPGRLLLLTHRSLDKTRRWGERVVFKTLLGLSPDEGAQLLGDLLASRGREAEVPKARRHEVSRWMGGNPRALRVLVGCLERDPLDELTGAVPEAWEARDQQVSDVLVANLERELLLRALDKLDDGVTSTLERLSVYRKAINRDGVMRLLALGVTLESFLADMTSRFLLEQRSGWYSLNPVAREISLHRLKGVPGNTRDAHRAAATHYTRHFNAQQIVHAGTLGGAFVEARYHLVQAGQEDELAHIAGRFGEHLRSLYGWATPAAKNPEERDEIISVLSSYLQSEGPKGMEYYLARLLVARGRPGDRRRALEHARRSTGNQSPADAWVVRLNLEFEEEDPDALLRAAREGCRAVPADKALVAVYHAAGELLARADRLDEAIALLRDGISKIPPEQNLVVLYESAGELLVRADRLDEAIALLRDGISKIPPERNLVVLYESAGELLARADRLDEAIALLRDGISKIRPEQNLYKLYQELSAIYLRQQDPSSSLRISRDGMLALAPGKHNRYMLVEDALFCCAAIGDSEQLTSIIAGQGPARCDPPQVALGEVLGLELRGDWLAAAERASRARAAFPSYLPLATAEAFAWLCEHRLDAAAHALGSFVPEVRYRKGTSLAWLSAMVALKRADEATAALALAGYLGRLISPEERPNLEWLLGLWAESEHVNLVPTPVFIHPNLAPSITGGRGWLRRFPHTMAGTTWTSTVPATADDVPPPVPKGSGARVASCGRQTREVLAVGTEWESRHGGLSTFNRDLCTALAAAGHQVVCVVPEATKTEREAAEGVGVRLVAPDSQPGLAGTEALLLETPLPAGFAPQLILGHDRKTGPHAAVLARRFLGAKIVHLVHTRPEDIEWHKDKLGGDDAATTAEQRKNLQEKLAAGAALVLGVGPSLAASASSLVFLANPRPRVHRLDPGFYPVTGRDGLPPEIQCLVLGRAEDMTVKGLDIAAKALGSVARRNKLAMKPRLVVRGAPVGTGKQLRQQLVDLAKAPLDIEVRDYSPEVERLRHDILMSSLVLVPSRSEGFGLVGLEAIAAATPVLVSDRSGLAVLLRERLGKSAEPLVVETHEQLDVAAPEWERAIEGVLLRMPEAFTSAAELREELGKTLNWPDAVRQLEAAWDPLFKTESTPTT